LDYDDLSRRLAVIRDADGRRPRAVRVLEAVLGVVDRGREHLRAWESVYAVVHGDSSLADLAAPFFLSTSVAHIETAALHAAKLIDTHGDSINANYLLNVIVEDRRDEALLGDWPHLKNVVASARKQLSDVEQVVARIKGKRDRDIAHLDKVHLNPTYEAQVIEVAELRRVFDAVEQIGQDLAATSRVFTQVSRLSQAVVEEWMGPEGLQDLLYFARAGFDSDLVESPSPRVDNIRKLARALRQAKDALGDAGVPDMNDDSSSQQVWPTRCCR
jgi:hypothetical protein